MSQFYTSAPLLLTSLERHDAQRNISRVSVVILQHAILAMHDAVWSVIFMFELAE